MLNKTKGFSLLEILFIIGFVSVFGLGIYYVVKQVKNNSAINQDATNIGLLKQGIKGFYGAGTVKTTELDNKLINNAGIVPSIMKGDSVDIIVGADGNKVIVSPTTFNAPDDGFRISFEGVTGNWCVKIIDTTGSQFERIYVNTMLIKQAGTHIAIDMLDLNSACAVQGSNGTIVHLDSIK